MLGEGPISGDRSAAAPAEPGPSAAPTLGDRRIGGTAAGTPTGDDPSSGEDDTDPPFAPHDEPSTI